MKNLILSAAACAAFSLTVNAQGYVPPVSQVAPGPAVTNPDFKQLPVVETGLPSLNLPGMNTVYINAETSPLVEGFGASYNTYTVQSTTINVSDRASQSESDPQEGKWIDRDNDGYDPVIDEIEQGAETAVKATGQALEEVGEEVGELFGNEDPDDVGEENKRGIIGKVVNGTGKAIKGTAKTTGKVAKGAVKTTGKVAKGTVKTTGKVARGTAKTTGKVVKGTGKAAVNGTKAVGRTTKRAVTGDKDENPD